MEVAFSLVRHNERDGTHVFDPGVEKEAGEPITRRCDKFGTTLTIRGTEMIVWKPSGEIARSGLP